MRAKQELLLLPTITELTAEEIEWVRKMSTKMKEDVYYETGGIHPDVHPEFIGFQILRIQKKAVPVYRHDNGVCAVDLKREQNSVSSWSVDENEVIRPE